MDFPSTVGLKELTQRSLLRKRRRFNNPPVAQFGEDFASFGMADYSSAIPSA
jgi:hypothetical protein